MRTWKTVAVFILLVMHTSCSSRYPTSAELSVADYGAPISQEDAESVAISWFRDHLKDPASAHYDWRSIEKGWIRGAIMHGSKLLFGYKLIVKVNAKNSYGGYTGFTHFLFLFHNGQIRNVWKEDEGRTFRVQ